MGEVTQVESKVYQGPVKEDNKKVHILERYGVDVIANQANLPETDSYNELCKKFGNHPGGSDPKLKFGRLAQRLRVAPCMKSLLVSVILEKSSLQTMEKCLNLQFYLTSCSIYSNILQASVLPDKL